MENGKYKKAFRDISFGCSKFPYENDYVYIKHLHPSVYIDIEEEEDRIKNKALKRGIPSEETAYKRCIEDGSWTKEDEDFIGSQQSFVDNLRKSSSSILLKSAQKKHQEMIDEESRKLNEKLALKNDLMGATAEKYAKQQINDFYIRLTFYKDKDCLNPLYSQEEYDELTYSDLSKLILINNDFKSLIGEDTIQHMVLQDFFFPYMFLAEKPFDLFGKAMCELTNYQVSVVLYSRIFKNIFDNNENIPEEIKKDPEALMQYSNTSKNKEHLDRHLSMDGATTVFGANKDDYKHLGVDTGEVKGSTSLTEAAKKKGGTLNMQDLMKLSGID